MLKTWWEKITSPLRKSSATYGISCDSSVKVSIPESFIKKHRVNFYRLRQNAGPFEIRRVSTDPKGRKYLIIYDAQSDLEIKVLEEMFHRLFEDYPLPLNYLERTSQQ